MANGQNGGRWALAGFLYQIVGMVSMVARTSEPADLSPNHGDIRADSLLMLPNAGIRVEAYHERFEDVAFMDEDGNKCVLVQFKYSGSGRKISVGEAREITRKLNDSVEAAEAEGYEVTACVLFTNRRLTSKGGRAAKQHWESEQGEHDYALHYCKSPTVGKLRRDLSEFGRKYGLFNHEIKEGIQSLIGRVFFQAGDFFNRPFDLSDLKQYFIGSRSARKLTVDQIQQRSHQHLARFGRQIGISQWNEKPIERTLLSNLVQAIHENRALIGLCGPGGCGKSTVLWQLLHCYLPSDRCCTYVHAEDVLENWIERLVHDWRGFRINCNDTREEAIERLLRANPDSRRPVLWLGLDGLDEGSFSAERKNHIRDILQWFWRSDQNPADETPLATLIVTTRKEDQLLDFLRLRREPLPSHQPLVFQINDFTERERYRAAKREAPEIYERLHRAGEQRHLREWTDSPEVWGSETHNEQSSLVGEDIWDSLKHPAMWQAYLVLDPEIRRLAIKGNAEAKHKIAHGFLQWVGRKLRMRLGDRVGDLVRNDYQGLLEILITVATHSNINTLNQRNRDWVDPARRTPIGISSREAEELYRESLSAGVIDEDSPRSWRWRHSLVYDYLMSCRRGE
jgi:hypothetical protein